MDAVASLRRAVARLERGEHADAWTDVRHAVEGAASDCLLHLAASHLLHILGDRRGACDEAKVAVTVGDASAKLLWCQRARDLGALHEVRTVLEDVLSSGPPSDTHSNSPTEEALRQLLQLYIEARYDEAAEATLTRYLSHARSSVPLALLAARIYARGGKTEQALAVINQILAASPPPSIRMIVASHLLEIGAFDQARAVYQALIDKEQGVVPALEALARLQLWTGDADAASACAARLRAEESPHAAACRIDAAVKILQGNPTGAIPLLDAALRDLPDDGEAYLWRAEAHLRLGHRGEAKRDADRSMYRGPSFAAELIHLLAELVPGRVPRAIWEHLLPELEQICPEARTVLAAHNARTMSKILSLIAGAGGSSATLPSTVAANGLIPLLERALFAMRGNRTPFATFVREDGTLVRVRPAISPRDASRDTIQLIKIASPEETFRHLEGVFAQFPESSMPWVYRGELHLWLGRYDDARADLERAIAVHRQTRWAWYGLACLDLLAGDPERALATCAAGIEALDNTEGPMALLCRGEAYRLLGRLREARDQLERSCEVNPTRLSSWVNLALVHGLAGDRAAQRDVVRRLAGTAGALLCEAALELGPDVFRFMVLERGHADDHVPSAGADEMIDRLLHHILFMMRGNRSSSCVTYFAADGQMRQVIEGIAAPSTEAQDRALRDVQALLSRAAGRR